MRISIIRTNIGNANIGVNFILKHMKEAAQTIKYIIILLFLLIRFVSNLYLGDSINFYISFLTVKITGRRSFPPVGLIFGLWLFDKAND